jgi:hypothetical protein
MQQVWVKRDVHTGFWWGDLMEREHREDVGMHGMILKCIFKKWDVEACTGIVWLGIGTGSGLL